MLWMAAGMFRSLPKLSLIGQTGAKKGGSLVLTGVLMSLANPYWYLWWATIGLVFILSAAEFGWLGVAVFFLGHILGDFVWYSFVSAIVAKGRSAWSGTFYRGLFGFCAAFLLLLALLFIGVALVKLFH